MALPIANLVLLAAHAVVSMPSVHEGLEELLAQEHAAVASQPDALSPRLRYAALYRQHQEWELAALDLQAAIKISGADHPLVMWGRLNLNLPKAGRPRLSISCFNCSTK